MKIIDIFLACRTEPSGTSHKANPSEKSAPLAKIIVDCIQRAVVSLCLVILSLFPIDLEAQNQQALIANTPHNLSVSGPGAVKAASETSICVFCHIPHGGSPAVPLWNRYSNQEMYQLYPAGSSMQSTPMQPNGSTAICLSCHDGMIAVGLVRSRAGQIALSGVKPGGELPDNTRNLGTSLMDDHPVSLIPSLDDPEIRLPSPTDSVVLDAQGYVQCRSCHDPHDNQFGKFLVKPQTSGRICLSCHQKVDWNISSHGNPQNQAFQQLITQACSSCHLPHNAPVSPRLSKLSEEDLCLACHDGVRNNPWETSGATNLTGVFQKASIHPIFTRRGVHDPGEGPIGTLPPPSKFLPEQNALDVRHVECTDCHNAHTANPVDPQGVLNGSLDGLWGITTGGAKINPATVEYQICYKCHADSRNLPAGKTNKRLEFSSANPSFHPITAQGKNVNMAGKMVAPITPTSIISCGSCHNNDQASPKGVHGSSYAFILKKNYYRGIGANYTASLYAHCFECHLTAEYTTQDRGIFKYHHKHVVSEKASCFYCHDSHGSATNSHLIYMDDALPELDPSSSGRLEFVHLASNHGRCYVTCHGKNHNPLSY
jgi:predicted CXXCH cytochrome family protein